jgi:hypothetical protein
MVTEQQVREDYRRWIGAMNAHDLALWDQFAEEMCTADYVHHPGDATPDKPAQDRLDLTLTRYEGRKVAEEWELLGELDPE